VNEDTPPQAWAGIGIAAKIVKSDMTERTAAFLFCCNVSFTIKKRKEELDTNV
jgi:hypothetical protein